MSRILISLANLLSTLIKAALYLTVMLVGLAGFLVVYKQYGVVIAMLSLPVIAFVLPILLVAEFFVVRIFIPKPKLGVHKIGSGAHFLYQLNNRIFNIAINPAFPPFAALYKESNIFRILTLKALGANVRFSSKVGYTSKIHDPYLLTVGTEATIDEDVQIYSFALEIGKIILRRIFIGPKAHVSAASVIFPGTEIGEGSVLGMGSSTRNEMRIPAYELWVGIPASHLSKLTRPVLYTAPHQKDMMRDSFKKPMHSDMVDRDHRREHRNGGSSRDYREQRDYRDRGDRDRGGDRGGDRRGGRFDRGERRGGRGRFERSGGGQGPRRWDSNPRQSSVAPGATPAAAPMAEPSAAPASPENEIKKPSFSPIKSPDNMPYIGPIDVPTQPQQPSQAEPNKDSSSTN